MIRAMRFLCDEMLRGLGKWLRAAGYDTAITEGGLPDRILTARCAADGRILLTKDRHLAATAASATRVVLLAGAGADENAASLRSALEIDWQHAPFTRCTVDNRPLDLAPADLVVRVPEGSRAAGGRLSPRKLVPPGLAIPGRGPGLCPGAGSGLKANGTAE